MATLLAQRETTDGNVYQKKRNVNGREYYVKKGEGVIPERNNPVQSWAGANRWRTGDTEISTPDGFKRVTSEEASKTGQLANYEVVDGLEATDTIEIQGQTYTAEQLREAYEDADEEMPDVGAVRYL